MSRLVVAGAWTIETNNAVGSDIVGSQPVSSRLTYLHDVLKSFDVLCQQISGWKNYSEGVLFIFVAPEYYFKSSKLDVERCLTKDERDTIIETIKKWSYAFPHTVIVPGTIIWSKPADDKSRKKAYSRLKETLTQQGINPKTQWVQSKWEQLRPRGQGAVQYLSYNSAYIFYDGSIYKYHKMNDASENLDGDLSKGTLFIPGSKPGYFPDLGKTGLNFGIEICADHQGAVLNQTVDVHILSSAATTTNIASIRARVGGLFIHAATGRTDFYVNNGGKFETPKTISIPYHPQDLLTPDQLEAQKDALIQQKKQAYGSAINQSYLEGLNKAFNLKARTGQLDCWVTELN